MIDEWRWMNDVCWCVLVCVECVCVMAKTMFCGGLFLRLVTVESGVIFWLGEFDMLISGHRNLDNFSQLEIGHCWDWCWSLILWVWLSVIECDWVCKLTFCNRCASRNASAKMCLSLCVCVFVCFQNDQCFKMIKIYASNHCDICNYLSDSNLIPQLKMIIQCMSLCVQCRIVLSDDCDLIFNLQVFRNE